MGNDLKPWRRRLGVVTLVLACVLVAGWMSRSMIQSRPIKSDRLDEVDAVEKVGKDDRPFDSTKYEAVFQETDPTTGSKSFFVDGSPVQGKLKAYLEDPALWEGDEIVALKTHPDAEPVTWLMIPKPLYLTLTDQSQPP